MDVERLHAELIAAIDLRRLPGPTRIHAYAVAVQVANLPVELAAEFGRVLTEHTAVTDAESDLHAFRPGAIIPFCLLPTARPSGAGTCGQPADSPVHRVEELTAQERESLLGFLANGDVEEIRSMAVLFDLGFIARGQLTPRGRAWLEAHPREGGEPS